ncbi:MAG: hypothetical protein K5987_04470 [Lachnospiraceae bacterium]|nr:hypothetical protein [Lachnospiraceae bacterium]
MRSKEIWGIDILINYYDNVVAFDDGTPYQGQIVQSEAIADMAGLKCMYLAPEDRIAVW